MRPDVWILKNPHSLSMVVTMHSDGTVTAEFPALKAMGMAWAPSPWDARDKAILRCAEAMVAVFKSEEVEGGPR